MAAISSGRAGPSTAAEWDSRMLGHAHLRQWVFENGQAGTRQLLQSPPGSRHSLFLFRHRAGIERLLGERPLANDRRKSRVDNKLSQRRIAADMPLPAHMQLLGPHFAQDE